ncbi:unnamed protein product, partial [Symbiodinium sp. KB8]
ELYQQALDSLGVSSFDAPKDKDTDVAEIFHLLGALRVQKLVGSAKEEEDDEKPSLQGAAAASLAEAIALLRCARASLPSGASDAARARVASSLGTALLHAPKGQEEQRMARAKGSSLEEAVAVLREDRERQGFTDELRALTEERIAALRAAQGLRPRHAGCLYRLGMACREKGENEEALTLLADFMEATEGDKSAGSLRRRAGASHWLAVLRGETTATAPAEYVAGLFDGYAERFDEHLVGALEYRTPELLAEELAHLKETLLAESPGSQPFTRCADLGCGTGLMGPPLRRLGVQHLEGVDLSAKMLEVAKDKDRGYSKLVCGDLVDIFEEGDQATKFDLVVAADVFVYVGDLRPALSAASRSLTAHGAVAFSTEAPPRAGSANEKESKVPEGGYKLAETGRYMHTASYVRSTAEACGLRLCKRANVVLRKNGGKPVHGHLHLLRKMSTEGSFPFASCDWPAGKMLKLPDACFMET